MGVQGAALTVALQDRSVCPRVRGYMGIGEYRPLTSDELGLSPRARGTPVSALLSPEARRPTPARGEHSSGEGT